jgi:hypothetical protein
VYEPENILSTYREADRGSQKGGECEDRLASATAVNLAISDVHTADTGVAHLPRQHDACHDALPTSTLTESTKEPSTDQMCSMGHPGRLARHSHILLQGCVTDFKFKVKPAMLFSAASSGGGGLKTWNCIADVPEVE